MFAVVGLGRLGYTMVLPAMQEGLGLNNTLAGSLATANLVGYAVMSLLGGAMASRFGTRRVVPVGVAVAAIGMAMTGTADSFGEAAAWRLLTGIGTGFANVPAAAMASTWFARRFRGAATGVVVAGSSLGLIVVGPLVPWILEAGGSDAWRSVWWIYGGTAAVVAMAAALLLRDRPADLGLRPIGTPGGAPVATRHEVPLAARRASPPVAPPVGTTTPSRGTGWRDIYRSPVAWHLGLIYFIYGLSYLTFLTFFTKHLITTGGYSPRAAGDLYMLMGWCTLVSGSLWGGLSDVMGRKWALALACLVQAGALAAFGFWISPVGFTTVAVVYGFTAWSVPTIMAATCGDLFGARLAPAALGMITVMLAAGQAVGPAVAGALADASGSFVSAFLLAAVVALMGSAAAALLGSTARRGEGR